MTYVRARLGDRLQPPARPRLPAVAAAVQRPPAGRPVSCSRGHPQAAAVSAADTRPSGHRPSGHRPSGHRPRTPTLWTATAVSEAAADSHGVRGVRFRGHPDTGHSVRLPGRLRQDGGGPTAAVPAPRSALHVSLARLRWSSGLGRRSRLVPAVRTSGHWTGPAGHQEPARPGTADTHYRRRSMRTPRQRPCWTAGSSTVHHRSHGRPGRDRKVWQRPAPPWPDRQIRSSGGGRT
jgi:hypothetical protein